MWRVRKRGRRDISLLHPQSLLLTLLTTDYSPYNPLELEAELQLGDLIARDAGGVGGADARGRAPRDPRERGARHLEVWWGFVTVRALRARVSLASSLTAHCALSGERGGWSSIQLVTENWLAARRGGAAGAADMADPIAERPPWARLPAALARLGAALARLRPPALNWLAGRLPPAPPPAFCWGCALPGALSTV